MKSEKIYICECGREFNSSQKINAHKSHCSTYLGPNRYEQRLYQLKKMASISGKQKSTEAKIKAQQNLIIWLTEQHVCEKCGKVMTEKFGSGRFCSRACANSHKKKTVKVNSAKKLRVSRKPEFVACSYCGSLIDISNKKKNKTNRYYCNGTCRNKHLNKLKEIGGINAGINIAK